MGEVITVALSFLGALLGALVAGWLQLRKSREERRSQRMVDAYREVAPIVEEIRRHAARALAFADHDPAWEGDPHDFDPHDPFTNFELWRREIAHGPVGTSDPPKPSSTSVTLFGSDAVRTQLRQLDATYTDLRMVELEVSTFTYEAVSDNTRAEWRQRQRLHAAASIKHCDDVIDDMAKELRADVKSRN